MKNTLGLFAALISLSQLEITSAYEAKDFAVQVEARVGNNAIIVEWPVIGTESYSISRKEPADLNWTPLTGSIQTVGSLFRYTDPVAPNGVAVGKKYEYEVTRAITPLHADKYQYSAGYGY